jgi:CHAT domain-containing protein
MPYHNQFPDSALSIRRLLKRCASITSCLSFLLLHTCFVDSTATHAFEKSFSKSGSMQGGILPLEIDKPIERDLSAGDKHSYRIQLNQGQYLRVTVEQQRIDVALSLTAADDRPLARMNSPYGFLGTESISMVADSAGEYFVEILSTAKAGAAGRYVLRAEPPREPTPSDLKRIQAERALTKARELHVPASLEKAVDNYKESLTYWIEVGDLYWQATTLYGLALACLTLDKSDDATQFYKQALSIQESIKDHRGQAYLLKDMGLLLGRRGKLTESVELSKKALPLWQKDNDLANQASTLNNLAVAYGFLGEPQQALEYHNQVLKIRLDLGDRSGKAQSLINIGTLYDGIGYPQTALDYYNEALSILRAIAKPTTEDRRREATALNNIGYAYAALGDPAIALSYYEQALPIRREVKDKFGEGGTLTNIGNAYLAMGDARAAMANYTQALNLPENNPWGKSYTRMNFGDAYTATGDSQAAIEHYNQALKLFTDPKVQDRQGEAAAHDKIGRMQAALGKLEDADNHYEQALALWRAVRDRRGEATTLEGLARNKLARNDLLEAQKQIDAAINIAENLRTGILTPQLRASYFASVRDYYELEIDILMQLHRQQPSQSYDRKALEISERARGRVLLETLGEVKAGLLSKSSPSLVERRRLLEQQLNAKAVRQLQTLSATSGEEKSASMDKEVQSLLAQIEIFDAQIRVKNPRYAALVQPQPLNIGGIQNILDPDTALLEFVLGDRRSYLWVVTGDSVASFELAKRAVIDEAVLKVNTLITARNQIIKGETPQQTEQRIKEAENKYLAAASALSQILFGSVGPLPASKRLLIVPDGKLQYISFAALPLLTTADQPASSEASKNGSGYQPLITKYEVVNLPSASVMATMRRNLQGRTPAPKMVAVLADPVFTRDDPRLKQRRTQEQKIPAQRSSRRNFERAMKAAGRAADETGIPRLFFSQREADSILESAGGQFTKIALGFEASRSAAISGELSQYRIIHFSAHGLLNDKHSELSGIILTLIDKRGQPQDGFLTLTDIYSLNLPAELAVLSACQTALGKEVRGEGLISLTRGFMYAGAARVVASLWKVDDAATADLMIHFYKCLLKEGQRPAEALRNAQLEMRKQKRWQSPYFWAAFTLQGEWK